MEWRVDLTELELKHGMIAVGIYGCHNSNMQASKGPTQSSSSKRREKYNLDGHITLDLNYQQKKCLQLCKHCS
jgi:hypothetical protein